MNNVMDSKNIKFIAYLRLNNIHPDKVEKFASGKANYYFNILEVDWNELKSEFNQSEYIKYAQCIDAVLDLAY